MEVNEIKKLLDRYWNCETTQEEEKQIRDFFSGENIIPDSMQEENAFFAWQCSQSKIKMDAEVQIMTVISGGGSKSYFYPFLKVAVSILVVLSTGIGAYTHYTQAKQIEETYSETYSDPEIAMKEAQAALNKVSSSLTKGEQIIKENLMDGSDTTIIIK